MLATTFLSTMKSRLRILRGGRSSTAKLDLLGCQPYYDKGPNTPYVCVFIGNTPYTGISSVANDPGTDGTVRWSGCGLNTRKITIDLTRTPIGEDGKPASRVSISPWSCRVDIPMIPVASRNHATLVSDPDDTMMGLILDFLQVAGENAYENWLKRAEASGSEAKKNACESWQRRGRYSGRAQ